MYASVLSLQYIKIFYERQNKILSIYKALLYTDLLK